MFLLKSNKYIRKAYPFILLGRYTINHTLSFNKDNNSDNNYNRFTYMKMKKNNFISINVSI